MKKDEIGRRGGHCGKKTEGVWGEKGQEFSEGIGKYNKGKWLAKVSPRGGSQQGRHTVEWKERETWTWGGGEKLRETWFVAVGWGECVNASLGDQLGYQVSWGGVGVWLRR